MAASWERRSAIRTLDGVLRNLLELGRRILTASPPTTQQATLPSRQPDRTLNSDSLRSKPLASDSANETERMSERVRINSLPGELLCKILQLSMDQENPKRARCRLSLVCRLWYQWMEGEACLWTQIWASDGLEYVRKAFIKSKDAPIDLKYDALIDLQYEEGDGAVDLMRIETFLQEASPHVARWRSLCIYSSHQQRNWEGALALLHAKPIPNLEKLVIFWNACTHMGSINSIAITVGDAASPKLKNIWLARAPVTIHATAFTTLRSFALDHIPGSSLREIIGVLQNSPQLKRLALEDGESLEVAEQDWSVHPIRFEGLGAVELRKLSASVTNFILSIVHAPNCRRLIIACEIWDPETPSTLFNASVSHLLLPFKEGGLTRPPVDVVVGEYTKDRHIYITIRVGYMEIDIRGFVDWASAFDSAVDGASALDSALRWIGDYSGSEASFQASLELTCRYSDPGYVEAFGPQFSVKRLTIYPDVRLLEYLSHPGQQGRWPFPQLEDLKCPVGRDQTNTALLNLITARYGHGGAEQSVGIESPTPLRSIKLLYLGPPPDLLIQQIQEILSDVEITRP